MNSDGVDRFSSPVVDTHRQETVLVSAIVTFARFGYRKTSMEEVARAAQISRPGLYFLFNSKEALFRAAVTHALEGDIAEVARLLGTDRPLHERLLDSFDQWAGRYVGPLSCDISAVIEDNPDMLATILQTAPQQFEKLITDAISADSGQQTAKSVAMTLTSTSIGIKHQVDTREAYLQRLEVALDLLTH